MISENNLPQKYVNEISGKALKDDKIDQCEDYKLHVARVRYALKSKLKTNEMKKSIFKKYFYDTDVMIVTILFRSLFRCSYRPIHIRPA